MYQVSVGVPPEPPPPQAARVPVATRAAATPERPRRNRRDLAGPSPGPRARRVSRPGIFGTVIASVGVNCEARGARSPESGAGHRRLSIPTVADRRSAAGPRPRDAHGDRQSSPTSPAITDGVVTSLGVRGSTVAK